MPESRASPWLGVSVADIGDHRYADPPGSSEVVISRIFADGPARKAGLRVGDIIESFNGAPVNTSRQLVDLKRTVGTGERIRFGIRRGNSALRLAMTAQ
ncbi:MAG: PDZ domain-containing protein [Chromatiaceae bacterium]